MPFARVAATTDHIADETGPAPPRDALVVLSSQATSDLEGSAPGGEPIPELRHERFQIGAVLGEGGMGVVYRARDTRDGRDVALKLMKGTLAGTARRRFEREFRSLAGASATPTAWGFPTTGEPGGAPFFTMELFLGRPITSLAGRFLYPRSSICTCN